MHGSAPTALKQPIPAILDDSEVACRILMLAELQAALADLGSSCVLARHHRLVLRYNDPPPQLRSGLTDPSLHVLDSAKTVVTTDGGSYKLGDGREFPVSEVAAVAAEIRQPLVDFAACVSQFQRWDSGRVEARSARSLPCPLRGHSVQAGPPPYLTRISKGTRRHDGFR